MMKRYAKYCASRWPEILVLALAQAVVAFVLHISGVNTQTNWLIVATIGAVGLVWLTLGYIRLMHTWAFYERLTSSDTPLDSVRDVPESFAPEYRAVREGLEAVNNDAHRRISEVSNESRQWREYVESWVHEIKTPIAAARLGVENNPGVGGARLVSQLDRMGFYVDQALFFARSASLDRDYIITSVEVYHLVSDALRERKHTLIDAGMNVNIAGVERGEYVAGDDKWLVFMLGQIIDNAAKYRAPERKPQLQVDFSYEGEGAGRFGVLTIRDNGLGIPARDVPRIFDKGFTGTHGRGGESRATGIGLYLVKNLAEKMGMDVRVQSVEGEGTALSLILPLP